MNSPSVFSRWFVLALAAVPAAAQTTINLSNQSKSVDFTRAAYTRPLQSGTALPSSCTVGDLYFRTDAAPGKNVYACTATNTWTVQSILLSDLPLASQPDALGGIDNTKLMTPLRTAEALIALCAVPPQSGNARKALVTDGSISTWSRFVRSVAIGIGLNLACYNGADSASGDCTVSPNLASQQESEAGTDNTKLMTPLRAKQAAKVGDPALFGRKVVWWLHDGGATTCNPCMGANGLDVRGASNGGAFSAVDPTATGYSMLRQTTGAAENNASSFHGGYATYRAGNRLYLDAYGTPLSGGAAAVRGWVGMTSAPWSEITATDDPSSFPTAAFRFSTSAGDTNWKIYTSDGTTSTTTATTVAADVNPHRFTIEFDLSNSQIKFYIDGALAGTSTTALPAGSQLLRWLMASTTLEGVDKSADAGWVYIEADR